jgi:3-oxoacyl-(acyl-carrier-protein) synthase
MSRRVVITGTGLLTAVGKDVQSSWTSLLAGVSGAAPVSQFDASDFPVRFACEVKDFDPADYIDRKEAKRTDRYAQLAIAASVQAMTEAGLDGNLGDIDPDTFGVIVGSAGSAGSPPSRSSTPASWRRGRAGSHRSSSRCSSRTSPPVSSRSGTARRVPTTPPCPRVHRARTPSETRSARSSTVRRRS